MGRYGWIGAAAFLLSCAGDKTTGDATPAGDADSDADSDADADADTDADSDAEPTGDTAPTVTVPSFDCYADEAYDLNLDGTFDISGYDGYDAVAVDEILYSDRDFDHDGLVDQVDTWTYDGDGNATHHEQTRTGYATLIEDWAWDAYGNRITFASDTNGDGVPEYSEKDSYDASNYLITASADTDGDGVDDLIVVFTRDADGNALTRDEDQDADGVVDLEYTFTYDAEGRVTDVAGDQGLDGTVDYTETTVYSDPVLAAGTTSVDDNADGKPELVYQFVVDAAGYETFYAEDADVDGTFEYTQTLIFDETQDLLVSAVVIEPGYTGAYPVVLNLRWTYDALGRETTFDLSEDAPTLGLYGAYKERESFTFGGTCPS